MQVVPGGHRCECGNRGCWEQYASGNALVREARAMVYADSPIASDLLARVGGQSGNLDRSADHRGWPGEGDQTARRAAPRDRLTGSASGIANLAAAFDPGTFVIGGGVSAAGDLLLDPARATFARQLTGRGYRPEARIVAASSATTPG